MEHRRVSLIRITTVNTARTYDLDWWLLSFHGTNLHTRRMRTQQMVHIKIESIVHGTRRVMTWNVQCFKVVIIIFNFRTCCNRKTCLGKELANTLLHLGHWMDTAHLLTTTW